MHTISVQVIQTLVETLKLKDASQVKMEDNLRDDLGLDSMSSLTFLINLEEKIAGFHVDPDTLDADYFLTVGAMTNYVEKQLSLATGVAA